MFDVELAYDSYGVGAARHQQLDALPLNLTSMMSRTSKQTHTLINGSVSKGLKWILIIPISFCIAYIPVTSTVQLCY